MMRNVWLKRSSLTFCSCFILLDFISDQCMKLRDAAFHKIGEDWVFLALLGVTMALMSFTMDYIIEKCQEGKFIFCWSFKTFII